LRIGYDSAVLTAVVVFLLAVATIFQYLMGVTGVPLLLGELLQPLESSHWLFLLGVALITMVFGMVLEGLPAAVVLIPVVFPIATRLGINPIHFDIVQTAAVGKPAFSAARPARPDDPLSRRADVRVERKPSGGGRAGACRPPSHGDDRAPQAGAL